MCPDRTLTVSGGTGLQNQAYLYDAIGNVTQRQESSTSTALTENFYYDNLYRLTSSQVNSLTPVTYAYDAMGNITSRSDVNGGATWTYHGTRKHAVATTGSGGASYSYDANGNMVSRDGATIGWASYNYPIYLAKGTETSQFVYGPDRQYYKQVYTDTGASVSEVTYYIGGLLERVDDGVTLDWRHNVVANGQVVAIVSRKDSSVNAVHYMLEDHQGSGSTLTDSSGALVVRASFNAFGLPRDGSDWDGAVPSGDQTIINGISRRGYTGHSMLGRMGLIHMNGRVQDAITGRFLSPDPTIPNPGFTQSYNRYAYVNNNPLSFIDPSGFAERDLEYFQGRQQDAYNAYGHCLHAAPAEACSYFLGDMDYWGSLAFMEQEWEYFVAQQQELTAWGRELREACKEHLRQGGENCGTALGHLLGAVGKVWNLPNTVIGVVAGLTGWALGGDAPTMRNNAFVFTNNPLAFAGAITIGNAILIGPPDAANPNWGANFKLSNGATVLEHEEQHTHQGQLLGPLYLPINAITGFGSVLLAPAGTRDKWHYDNYMEKGPESSPPRPWP